MACSRFLAFKPIERPFFFLKQLQGVYVRALHLVSD
jgi:hypothetical protein